MYRPLTFFVAILATLSFSASAHATPASDATIDQLFKVMNLDKVIISTEAQVMAQSQQLIPNLVDSQIGQILSKTQNGGLTPEMRDNLKVIASDFSSKLSQEFQQEYPKQVSVSKFARASASALYRKYYTDEELKDLITFYQSPVGQKSLVVTPKLVSEQMDEMSKNVFPQINKLIYELVDKEGPKLVDEINKSGTAPKAAK